jgi:hypothetical protein
MSKEKKPESCAGQTGVKEIAPVVLSEISVLAGLVTQISHMCSADANAARALSSLFKRAKWRLLSLIPDGAEMLRIPDLTGKPLQEDTTPQGVCVNCGSHSIDDAISRIPCAQWGTFEAGKLIPRDVDVAVAGDLLVFRVKSDALKESGYTVARRDDPTYMGAPLQLLRALEAREAAAKKSKPVIKPGGTLKAKVKTVSSVETVKAKAKKKGKA